MTVRSEWFLESTGPERREDERPAPLIVGLWEGEDGLIWTLIRDADSEWQPPPAQDVVIERPRDPDEYNETYDWIVEAVDASTGSVVASRRFDDYLGHRPPTPLLVSVKSVDMQEVVLDVWRPVLRRKEQRP